MRNACRDGVGNMVITLMMMFAGVVHEAVAQDVSGRTPPSVTRAEKTPLLPAEGLDGWNLVSGDATIEYENGVLRGHDAGDRNAFLMSDRTWGDFILEGEVRIEPGGNSGWQIRSALDDPENPASRLRGYQVEVETTDRRWSGGIYEEGRRGWLDPLLNDEEARAAFKIGEWNRYRIEVDGIHIRSWVNGVPCGDLLDLARLEGHIAFQIHTGPCDVRWRNLEITDLGRSRFVPTGRWRVADESVDVSGDERTLGFTPPDGTSTIRFDYSLEGRAVLVILDQRRKVIMNIALQDDADFISGTGIPSRFPEVVPGAGIDIRTDGRNEVVVDLHRGRITIMRDGVILSKRYDLGCSSIGGVRLITPGEAKNSIKPDRVQCLLKETKPKG